MVDLGIYWGGSLALTLTLIAVLANRTKMTSGMWVISLCAIVSWPIMLPLVIFVMIFGRIKKNNTKGNKHVNRSYH